MLKMVHPIAGALAILTIATFWLSTALAELFGSPQVVVAVKTAIPWGFLLLIPCSLGPEAPASHCQKGGARDWSARSSSGCR